MKISLSPFQVVLQLIMCLLRLFSYSLALIIKHSRAYHNTHNKPFRHLNFRDRSDLNTLVTSTPIGRIGMSCAHAQWVRTGYWHNSEGSVWPDPVRLHTHVESAYWNCMVTCNLFNL